MWLHRIASSAQFLAIDQDEVVGTATGFVDPEDATTALLVAMYVAPAARGQGIGERLVDAVVAQRPRRRREPGAVARGGDQPRRRAPLHPLRLRPHGRDHAAAAPTGPARARDGAGPQSDPLTVLDLRAPLRGHGLRSDGLRGDWAPW